MTHGIFMWLMASGQWPVKNESQRLRLASLSLF
jgi:hypothetical protein